jgi:hypothetical protein
MPLTAAVGEDPAAKISARSPSLSLSLSAPKLTLELPPSHIQPAPDTGQFYLVHKLNFVKKKKKGLVL